MCNNFAIDLDGVLADTMVSFCKLVNLRHTTRFEVSSFEQRKAWETAHITPEEFFRTLDEAWLDWQSIPPTEANLSESVGRLQKFGRVDIVTGRSLGTVDSAKRWLEDKGIKFNSFVRTNSTMDKAKLKYDVYVDDSPELMSYLGLSSDRVGILYTRPWNRNLLVRAPIFRADTWSLIPEMVKEVLNSKNQ